MSVREAQKSARVGCASIYIALGFKQPRDDYDDVIPTLIGAKVDVYFRCLVHDSEKINIMNGWRLLLTQMAEKNTHGQ